MATNVLGRVKAFYLSYTSGSYHGMAAIRSILGNEGESVVGEFPALDSISERGEILFLNGVSGIYENDRDRGNYWAVMGTKGYLEGNRLCLFDDERELEVLPETAEAKGKSRITGARIDMHPEISFRDVPR